MTSSLGLSPMSNEIPELAKLMELADLYALAAANAWKVTPESPKTTADVLAVRANEVAARIALKNALAARSSGEGVLRGLHTSGVNESEVTHRNPDVTVGNPTYGHEAARRTWEQITGEDIGPATAAASVISSASPLSEEERACFERLTRLVWALGQWNDHNFTHADYAKWRKDAQAAALAAEPIIDRLSASAPSPEDDKPKPRALRQVRPHTVGSAYICGRCAKSHVVGCDPNGIVGGRPCPNSPSPEDKGSDNG